MQIHGILKQKFDTQVVSDKFKKREFVLETETNTPYPQPLLIQVTQDKCVLLDNYNEGDEISVDFNLRGREWNGPQGIKFFNTIEAWRFSLVNKGIPAAAVTNLANTGPTANQAQIDVQNALAKLTPEARAALLKSIGGEQALEGSQQQRTDDNLDLPF